MENHDISLSINPETIYAIIDRIHEFQAKEGIVLPEEMDAISSHSALQILADHQDDLSYQEALNEITNLEPDQQAELIALMWLGRGDYSKEEWKQALEEITRSFNFYNQDVGRYLFGKPQVVEYLLEGLKQLGYPNEEAWLSK